jgi:uncharacterized protein YbgA (DUF1722 family)
MERVPVYGVKKKGTAIATGQGVFARVFMEHFPLVPVVDDGRLHDPQLREGFIERVLVMKQWRDALRHTLSRGDLVQFHTAHKLMILSHSPRHSRIMGGLVARAKALPLGALYAEYQRLLAEALRLKATPAKHANVLQHIMGYFKKQLSPEARQELREVIASYRQGQVSLIVPVTLINYYVRLYDLAYLKGRHYLHPHPLQLQVRDLL